MKDSKDDQIRKTVRDTYGQIAKSDAAGCGCGPSSCCGQLESPPAQDLSVKLG